MKLDIKTNIDKFVKTQIKNWDKQIRFATNLAATRIAQIVRKELTEEISKVYNQPTSTTKKSILYKAATGKTMEPNKWSSNKPYAIVFIQNETTKGTAPVDYLRATMFGGARNIKRTETRLRDANILPSNMYVAPAKKAKLNKYGNLPTKDYIQLLSYLKTFNYSGESANVTDKTKNKKQYKYFVLYKSGQPIGIWNRTSKKNIKPVLMFINKPSYKKQFDFLGKGMVIANREIPKQFAQALKDARSTAKPAGNFTEKGMTT